MIADCAGFHLKYLPLPSRRLKVTPRFGILVVEDKPTNLSCVDCFIQ